MNRALIVGINRYADSRKNLRGCMNDASKVARVCSNRFKFNDIQMLLNEKATKLNILIALKTLINTSTSGDHVLFYFSGHGGQVPDKDDDEADFLDECLITYDHDWDDALTDDDIKQCLWGHNRGVGVTLIIDACHSGTMTDEDNKTDFHPEPIRDKISELGDGVAVRKLGRKQKDPETQRHILLAACNSGGVAYEVVYRRRRQGLMTAVFLNYIRTPKYRNSSWAELFRAFSGRVRKRSKLKQSPVIYGPKDLLNELPFSSKSG